MHTETQTPVLFESPVKVALRALKKHAGNVDRATAETGLLRSFVADLARQFEEYL